ncbi:hypothetical protein HMJ29_03695 [Hymenobacter taeanensis]|uniref:Anti-sigma factor n=1 Tax=Hymenobacter taeanensis TaxID=2735321 RepID=A0A6M6BDQ6_9BACT|nr:MULTISPECIES: hypothetical protein [Hymenobacter]QJX46090.1 hypothetical protein HMJ29_03695 [Hymenobacter taeanensis]UOQ79944.1 hypothetical protein MUN83_13950 [Hymenobacter sp. 5414T-23]
MNEKKTGLESFVERHRADFDAFEPRPNLWDDIELDLTAPAVSSEEEAPLRIVALYPEEALAPLAPVAPTTPPAARTAWPYGIAASVAAIVMAGYFWQAQHPATIWTRASATTSALAAQITPDAQESQTFYKGPGLTATAATDGPEQRLGGAVQRMESYYAAQITERQQELTTLDAEMPAAPRADWRQELTSLDSTYRQLKVELYRNPEPDVVLEAMNRNLQIRLDLLTQQLRTRERIRDYHNQPYMVADSRRMP